MSAVNETLIRDIVAEVMGRLNGGSAPVKSAPAAPTPPPSKDCGCNTKKSRPAPALRGKFGVFATADEACDAAQEAFLQLKEKGIAARRKIEEIVKALAEKNAEAWGKLNLKRRRLAGSTTRSPSWDHQARAGVDWLRPGCAQRRSWHHAGGIHAVRRRRRDHAEHAFHSHVERQHRQHLRRRQFRGLQRASERSPLRGRRRARLQRGDLSRDGH
jgi:hypothetical protein